MLYKVIDKNKNIGQLVVSLPCHCLLGFYYCS
uniref:Uncharacterized protein n=1 Tax=Siphoviridae sp. ctTfn5 TaxID=2827878 RepID=A0A8S5TIM4_9CAUD|nr:MAG TPA: hypothetical protein [Siphoviridae sp. ctTfn5]